MSTSAIDSLKDFFKECPILDDNSTRVEVVKFLLKVLLFLQIHVVNFRLPQAYQNLLDGDFPPALRQFGEEVKEGVAECGFNEDDEQETVSLSSVLSAGDERGEEIVDDEVHEDVVEAEIPTISSSTSSSKSPPIRLIGQTAESLTILLQHGPYLVTLNLG